MSDSYQHSEYVSRINRVIDYIENNLDQDLSLAVLAKVANFSPFYFHRIFRAMVDEPLNQFIQRVKVEKSAIQLITNPGKSITEIALDYGYSSSASFARIFKDRFQMSASEYRKNHQDKNSKIGQIDSKNQQTLSNIRQDKYEVFGHFESVTNQFKWRIKMTGFKDIHVEVKEMPAFNVAYVRHIGPYAADEDLFRSLYERLMKWAMPRDLFKPDKTTFMSVYHDDPKITDENKLRVSACLTVPEGTETDGEVGHMVVPGGKFAVATCEINVDEYEQAWDALMGGWMPNSGYQPDDRLCYEIARNNPDEHPKKMHVVDICVPVKPL